MIGLDLPASIQRLKLKKKILSDNLEIQPNEGEKMAGEAA